MNLNDVKVLIIIFELAYRFFIFIIKDVMCGEYCKYLGKYS